MYLCICMWIPYNTGGTTFIICSGLPCYYCMHCRDQIQILKFEKVSHFMRSILKAFSLSHSPSNRQKPPLPRDADADEYNISLSASKHVSRSYGVSRMFCVRLIYLTIDIFVGGLRFLLHICTYIFKYMYFFFI